MMTPISWKGVRRVADRGTRGTRSMVDNLKPGAKFLG